LTRRRTRIALAGAAALAVLTAGAAGCGLGAGPGPRDVALLVTRDFGAHVIGTARIAHAPGAETVLRFVERSFRVQTGAAGAVESIDGVSGGRASGWFLYVNGSAATRGPGATRLHPGDRVWWDLHNRGAATSISAVVGSFPQPFRSGIGGQRLPVQLVCSAGAGTACGVAGARLGALGVPFGSALLGAPAGTASLRLLVGPWPQLRDDPAARQLELGPRASGVFAIPDARGRWLRALDARGRTVRVLGAGSGLVAATRARGAQPTWLVTGTNAAGVLAAARALTQTALADHFAIAIVARGELPLP
jgi:hypothetical protein